nr:MAG TPA: hypothetical protein [Caudoviricetes sp.]
MVGAASLGTVINGEKSIGLKQYLEGCPYRTRSLS